jgi:hypothetical protein
LKALNKNVQDSREPELIISEPMHVDNNNKEVITIVTNTQQQHFRTIHHMSEKDDEFKIFHKLLYDGLCEWLHTNDAQMHAQWME